MDAGVNLVKGKAGGVKDQASLESEVSSLLLWQGFLRRGALMRSVRRDGHFLVMYPRAH